MTTEFLLFLCRHGTLERLSFTVHEKRQFDRQKQRFGLPVHRNRGFRGQRATFEGPVHKIAGFRGWDKDFWTERVDGQDKVSIFERL